MTAAAIIFTVFVFGATTGTVLEVGKYDFSANALTSESVAPSSQESKEKQRSTSKVSHAPPGGFSRVSRDPVRWEEEDDDDDDNENGGGDGRGGRLSGEGMVGGRTLQKPLLAGSLDQEVMDGEEDMDGDFVPRYSISC